MGEELYKKLFDAGYYTKSLPEFQTKYGTPEGQQELYSKLNSSGFYTKDFNSFSGKYFSNNTPDNGLGRFNHILGSFNKGALGVASSTLKGLGESAAAFDRGVSQMLGVEQPVNTEENTLYKLGKGLENITEEQKLAVTNPKYEQEGGVSGFLSNEVPQGLGSTVPFMLAAMAGQPEAPALALEGQVLSRGALLKQLGTKAIEVGTSTGGVMGGSVAIDQTYQEAKQAGRTDEEAFATAIKNYVGGATEAIPLERILGRLTKLTEGQGLARALTNTGKQMVSGGIEEGLQETLQQYWANQIAKGDYDPERDPLMGVLKSGGSAFVVGMLIPFAANTPNISVAAKNKLVAALGGQQENHPAQTVIDEFDQATKDISTGDPNLDQTINQLQDNTAKTVNDLFDQVAVIEGRKTQEEIQKLREDNLRLQEGQKRANQKEFIKQIYESFNQAPVVNPVQFTTEATEIPKYNPQTLDEEGTQPAESFKMVLPKGEANGIIAGGMASLNEIYANKDAEGNPVKGGNLYGNLIEQLRNKGIQKLRVGAQSPASASILEKLVNKGELQVDPKGDIVFGNRTIHTQFNISEKANDRENQQGVQSEIGERQEPLQPQPIESPSGEEIAPSGVLQAPQESIRQNPPQQLEKELAKVEPKKADLELTLQTRLENALKRAPSRRIAALDAIIEKADREGFTQLRDKAQKLQDKEIESQNVKEEEQEIRKKARTPKMNLAERKEFLAKQKEEKLKQLEEKKKSSKMLKEVEGAKVNVKQAKESFLKEIAYLRESGNKDYKKMAENYIQFREKQGLKEIPLEKALEESKAEFYVASAKKRTEKERENRRSVEHKLQSMKKEGKPAEEIAKAKKSLEEELRQDIEKKTGIKLSFLHGVNMEKYFNSLEFKLDIESMAGENADKRKISKSSVEEFLNRVKQIPHFKAEIVADLTRAVEAGLKKQGKELQIYHYNTDITGGGLYGSGKDHNLLMTAGKLTKEGNFSPKYIDTLLHEIMHGYTALLSQMATNADERFSRVVNKTYDSAKATIRESIQKSLESTKKGKLELNRKDHDILKASLAYIKDFYGAEKFNYLNNQLEDLFEGSITDSKKVADLIVDSIYGLTNRNEMLSELATDSFVHLLSVIPSENKAYYKNGKLQNSVLSKLFEGIRQFVKTHLGFEGPSVFDELENIVNEYAARYEQGTELASTTNPYFYVPTLKDIEYEYPSLNPREVIAHREKLVKEFFKNEAAAELKPGKKPSKKELNLNEKIIANIAKTLEKRKEFKSVNDVREYLKGVNARLVEARKLGDVYAEYAFSKVEALRRKRAIAKEAFNKNIAKAKANPKYKTSFKFKQDVDDFASVDIEAVPNDKLGHLNASIDSLSRDQFVDQKGYDIMINYGKKLTKLNALVKIASKIDQNVGVLTHKFANPASYSTIVARYDKKTSTELLRHVYGGTMEAFSNVTREAHDFVTELSKYSERNEITRSNLTKIGMYGSIFSTKTDPRNVEAWQLEIKENAKHVLESAINKKSAKEQSNYKGGLNDKNIEKEIEIAKELNQAIEKSPKMEGILSKQEQGFYDKFRDFSKKHERDFERNTIGTWGNENYESRFNYFPTQAQGKVAGLMSNEDDEIIRDNKDNLMEALERHDVKGDENNIYSKKVWSQYKRVNPKGYFYNYDALNIAERWSKNMLYDLYATTELKALNRLLRDQTFQKTINKETRSAFRNQLKSIAGVGNKYDSEAGKFLTSLMNVRDSLYTATLATSGQIASQSSSGFAAAAVISAMSGINAPKVFAKAVSATFKSSFYSDTSKLQEFLKKEGLGIQLRDILFEKYLSSDSFKTYNQKRGRKIVNSIESATEWGLRQGDKLGARVVWFAAYFNAGGTLENPSRDAVLEAERQVGIMQNMSDINFSAPAFKYDTVFKKMVVGMFYAYKSFAVNSYLNLLYSSRYALNSGEARQVLMGQLASVVAYHAVAAALVKPFYDSIVDYFAGGDDDEDKEKSYSKAEQIIAESLWDTGALTPLFGMAAPAGVDAFSRYIFAHTAAPKMYGQEYEPFNQYTDNPIYSMKNMDDVWKAAFGPGYREFGEVGIAAANALILQAQQDEYFESIEDASKREQKLEEFELMLVTDLAAALPVIPLRGDLKRIMQGVYRKTKAQYLNNNMKGKSGVNSGENELRETPTYEEKDYELINQ